MDTKSFTLTPDQIGNLGAPETVRFCRALLDVVDCSGDDGMADALYPLMCVLEQSLMSTPIFELDGVSSIVMECLAAKVWVVCRLTPNCEADRLQLLSEVERILGIAA